MQQFSSYPTKSQHPHASVNHHQYAQQQQHQYATSQGDLIVQTTSGTPYMNTSGTPYVNASGTPYVNTSIAPRRYNTAPPTLDTPRQFPSTQHSSIAPLTEHPPSPSQMLPTNNVSTISSSISSSLPASLPTPPPTVTAGLSPNSGNAAAAASDLHNIVAQIGTGTGTWTGTQTDLRLILNSKTEEDKRKAEETKLRVREHDLMLYERNKQIKIAICQEITRLGLNLGEKDFPSTERAELRVFLTFRLNNRTLDSVLSILSTIPNDSYTERLMYLKKLLSLSLDHVDEPKSEEIHSNQDIDYENGNSIGTFPATDGTLNYASFGTNLSSPVQNLSINSPSNNPISQSTPQSSGLPKGTPNDQNTIVTAESITNGTPNKRKRKRREMLPVTMIIETKEHPYDDKYLWKNNGNTTQRKTGKKSVYFKCSNSNKGCPVNKTVSEKEGGWIIKYRGHHIEECGKIKRIVQT